MDVDIEQIYDWLEVLGRSSSFLEKNTRDLSGGESQIAALLRAAQLEPNILLLDEPTSALDQTTTKAVEHFVDQWQRQQSDSRSFIVVSHDRTQIDRMVDRIVVMRNGALVAGNHQ